jgi:hypothetical protein
MTASALLKMKCKAHPFAAITRIYHLSAIAVTHQFLGQKRIRTGRQYLYVLVFGPYSQETEAPLAHILSVCHLITPKYAPTAGTSCTIAFTRPSGAAHSPHADLCAPIEGVEFLNTPPSGNIPPFPVIGRAILRAHPSFLSSSGCDVFPYRRARASSDERKAVLPTVTSVHVANAQLCPQTATKSHDVTLSQKIACL